MSEAQGPQGLKLALVIALAVAALAATYAYALKASPGSLPGPTALFFMTAGLSAGVFLLISVRVAWLFDPTHHGRHFMMFAISLPLHFFFFGGILDAYLANFLPGPSFVVFFVFAFLTAYASASAAALAVIHRDRLGVGRHRR